MAPAPKFIDTWAIALLRKAIPSPKASTTPAGANGEPSLPEEDLTDGFMSESNADSSDTGRARKSTGGKKKKLTSKK